MYREAFGLLPDIYKLDTPNNKKIYQVLHETGHLARMEALEGIRDSKDIDKAEGDTLELHGGNVQAKRPPGMSDEEYRKIIKIKIFVNRSSGEVDSMNEIGDTILGDDFIKVKETWQYDIYDDIAGMVAEIRPNLEKVPNMLEMAKAGGVKLFFETWGEDEVVLIEEEHSLTKTKFNIAGRTKTESKKVHTIKDNILPYEQYGKFPVKYGTSGKMKAKSVAGEMDYEDIRLEKEYLTTKFKYGMSGKVICGGAR